MVIANCSNGVVWLVDFGHGIVWGHVCDKRRNSFVVLCRILLEVMDKVYSAILYWRAYVRPGVLLSMQYVHTRYWNFHQRAFPRHFWRLKFLGSTLPSYPRTSARSARVATQQRASLPREHAKHGISPSINTVLRWRRHGGEHSFFLLKRDISRITQSKECIWSSRRRRWWRRWWRRSRLRRSSSRRRDSDATSNDSFPEAEYSSEDDDTALFSDWETKSLMWRITNFWQH